MARRIPARLTAKEGRKFAFPVGAAFLVIGSVLVWRDRILAAEILGGVGGLLLVCGVLIPTWLGPVERAWMGFAQALSKVTTPIFMAVVYFLVILPVGVLRRTIGKNPMEHEEVDGSYWRRREVGGHSDMTRQF